MHHWHIIQCFDGLMVFIPISRLLNQQCNTVGQNNIFRKSELDRLNHAIYKSHQDIPSQEEFALYVFFFMDSETKLYKFTSHIYK